MADKEEKALIEKVAQLRSKENPSWSEIRDVIEAMKRKRLKDMDASINSSLLPPKDKVYMQYFRQETEDKFAVWETLTILAEGHVNLKTALSEVTNEVEKIKGTSQKLESISKKLEEEESSQKQAIISIVQKFSGSNFGNIVGYMQGDFNQQVTDAFKQAYNMVEIKADISAKQKEEIVKNLKALEEELHGKKLDAGKIQKLLGWLKKNASWVAPIVAQVAIEGIKIALMVS